MKYAVVMAALATQLVRTASAVEPGGASAVAAPGGLFQVMLGLSLVLGLLVAAAWAIKRFGPKRLTGGAAVKIVGGISLGGRERVLVLEVADQWIVVGAAPGRVNALATLPRQTAPVAETVAGAETGDHKNFGVWLKQMIEKRNDQQ